MYVDVDVKRVKRRERWIEGKREGEWRKVSRWIRVKWIRKHLECENLRWTHTHTLPTAFCVGQIKVTDCSVSKEKFLKCQLCLPQKGIF